MLGAGSGDILNTLSLLILEMINPLHPPVSSYQQSKYSTLSGALLTDRPGHPAKRLPQPAYAPLSKWQAAVNRLGPIERPIAFDYAGHGGVKRGVKMHHLIACECEQSLSAGTECVLMNGPKRITFRILVSFQKFPSLLLTLVLTTHARFLFLVARIRKGMGPPNRPLWFPKRRRHHPRGPRAPRRAQLSEVHGRDARREVRRARVGYLRGWRYPVRALDARVPREYV